MSVFDNSGFAARHRQDFRSLHSLTRSVAPYTTPTVSRKDQDWNEGFTEGWKAAVDRYIAIDKEEENATGQHGYQR